MNLALRECSRSGSLRLRRSSAVLGATFTDISLTQLWFDSVMVQRRLGANSLGISPDNLAPSFGDPQRPNGGTWSGSPVSVSGAVAASVSFTSFASLASLVSFGSERTFVSFTCPVVSDCAGLVSPKFKTMSSTASSSCSSSPGLLALQRPKEVCRIGAYERDEVF